MYCSMSCSRAWRSPCSWYRRSSALSFSRPGTLGLHPLHRLHELDLVALEPVRVRHRPEHTREAELGVLRELACEPLSVDRTDARDERVALDPDRDGHGAVALALLEEACERELQILEMLEREVEPDGEAAHDEVGDAEEVPVAREGQPDLVGHAVRSASRNSSASSCCRREAASFAAAAAPRKSRCTRKSANPWLRPAARPETFTTGRWIAKLTVRMAVSSRSTVSTALFLVTSTLSSCPFTRSTEPPSLLITGRISSCVPLMNAERRARVPPRRTKAYAIARPVASRKTLSARYARSPELNASAVIRARS